MSEQTPPPEQEPGNGMSKKQFRAAMLMIIVIGLAWSGFNQFWAPESKRDSVPASDAAATAVKAVAVHREYRCYPIMGTVAEVSLYGDPELTGKAADTVYDTFREIETVGNIYDAKSELSQLNRTAARQPFVCSELLWQMLTESRRAWKLSGGAFDVTARPLMVMWGFYVKSQQRLPDAAARNRALAVVGMDKVIFNDRDHTVKFTRDGMSIDLGGIAKGFAVDLAVVRIRKMGIACGVVNLAGNMYCFPQPPPGKNNYTIGIRDPLDKDKSCGTIVCRNISVATSGNYERYVVIGGKQYTHIMNVKTGMTVQNMLAVSVVTPRATDADWLSTAIFINGEAFGRRISRDIPGTSALLIRPGRRLPEVIRIGDIWGEIKL
ncbi:MAG: FAD:protein FMN transferase [Victivallales bacterium]|nr:FAD:protein FMN transferase [Victivallales bacterium]